MQVGLLASTMAAIVLKLDDGAIQTGLYGYNGLLVGLGLSVFLTGQWEVRAQHAHADGPHLARTAVAPSGALLCCRAG